MILESNENKLREYTITFKLYLHLSSKTKYLQLLIFLLINFFLNGKEYKCN